MCFQISSARARVMYVERKCLWRRAWRVIAHRIITITTVFVVVINIIIIILCTFEMIIGERAVRV
jgi:hypothetical protein